MELKDLLLTPIYLGVFYAIAFGVRKRFTNVLTKKYFIPALSVKFLGAIALGLPSGFQKNIRFCALSFCFFPKETES
jgi:hypothetical protein